MRKITQQNQGETDGYESTTLWKGAGDEDVRKNSYSIQYKKQQRLFVAVGRSASPSVVGRIFSYIAILSTLAHPVTEGRHFLIAEDMPHATSPLGIFAQFDTRARLCAVR